ncbi:type VII toxin-antitoxin system MntA family adenylyltransferase antitoxin [Candidatus Contubernalis alkaliaceticus]|uniref:type VII toxin-antitoxin system MntA family adenylyltransferase antitoxin n=1 Tax=Candidatus Contubernalis alkaliaceticus TaxID=338645 RepID=UPI001F4C2C32|nr:nucleotidyltransferase domain-containing protein [Candidatus Contubernalis alkalaceticus]
MKKLDMLAKLSRFIQEINREYPIEFAYLFGSFSTEKANKESDIDVAVMFQKKYENKREMLIKGNIIDMGMKYFKRKLDIVSLNNAAPLLRYEVVVRGIPVKESSKRAAFESLAVREYFDFRYYAEIYNEAMIQLIHKQI